MVFCDLNDLLDKLKDKAVDAAKDVIIKPSQEITGVCCKGVVNVTIVFKTDVTVGGVTVPLSSESHSSACGLAYSELNAECDQC